MSRVIGEMFTSVGINNVDYEVAMSELEDKFEHDEDRYL